MAKCIEDPETGVLRWLYDADHSVEYTPELGEEICVRIAQGETLISICRDDHMPNPASLYMWLDNFPEFAKIYQQARLKQADYKAEEVELWANRKASDPVDVSRHRLIVDTLKWRAAQQRPTRWGKQVKIHTEEGNFKDWTELAAAAEGREEREEEDE